MRGSELSSSTMTLVKKLMLVAIITVIGIVLLSHIMSTPKQVTVVVLNRNPVNSDQGPPLRILQDNEEIKESVKTSKRDDATSSSSSSSLPKIKDLPMAINPSDQQKESGNDDNTFVIDDNVMIDFPEQLPAGMKVDKNGDVYMNGSLLFRKDMMGYLNVDIWTEVEGILVDDLRLDRRYPDKPSNTGKLTSFYNSFGMYFDDYAEKIYGYVIPIQSGFYKFAVASDDTSEVWLSKDHHPKNLRKIACLGCIDPADIPQRFPPPAPPVFAADSSFSVHPRQVSSPIRLEAYKPYYIEVYHKEGTEADYVNVNWQLPYSSEMSGIPRNQFTMAKFIPSRKGGKVNPKEVPPPLKGPFPSAAMQRPMKVPYVGNDVVDYVVLPDVLPSCNYTPAYISVHNVERYTGFKEVLASLNYPDDHTWHKNGRHESEGNPIIDEADVTYVVDNYIQALEKSKYGKKYDAFKLRFMEATPNVKDGQRHGWRYLLEAEIKWKDGSPPTFISEYLYRPEANSTLKYSLCTVEGFQWNRTTHVNLVVTVKNIGRWIKHLIRNMEDIRLTNNDDRFTIIVCDFESSDLNISQALLESQLKPSMYKLIPLTGNFRKTLALQAGIDWVKDPRAIVMTLDLHLTLPTGIMNSIRKHSIFGKMGYAPEVFRLGPAFTENNIQGYWETMGYGLLGMFKADWDLIGGQNVKEFSDKWGGEDWETVDRVQGKGYETFRHRYPGLVHYYHSHKGMWND